MRTLLVLPDPQTPASSEYSLGKVKAHRWRRLFLATLSDLRHGRVRSLLRTYRRMLQEKLGMKVFPRNPLERRFAVHRVHRKAYFAHCSQKRTGPLFLFFSATMNNSLKSTPWSQSTSGPVFLEDYSHCYHEEFVHSRTVGSQVALLLDRRLEEWRKETFAKR